MFPDLGITRAHQNRADSATPKQRGSCSPVETLDLHQLRSHPCAGQANPNTDGRYRATRTRCSLSTSSARAPGAPGAERTPARLSCKVSSYRPGPSKRWFIRKFQ